MSEPLAHNAEMVRVPAVHLLHLMNLISECIEDLAEEEKVMLEEIDHALQVQAPNTLNAYFDRLRNVEAFYQVAAEGGLLSLGPEEGS